MALLVQGCQTCTLRFNRLQLLLHASQLLLRLPPQVALRIVFVLKRCEPPLQLLGLLAKVLVRDAC
eukprot:scaffold8474_cov258-Pinguiococcus_pyrenoidosus.AAC.4